MWYVNYACCNDGIANTSLQLKIAIYCSDMSAFHEFLISSPRELSESHQVYAMHG